MNNHYLTVDDVAERLKTSRTAIYQRIYRGEFPSDTIIRFGKRRLLFKQQEFFNFINSGGGLM
jgi:excisionase family DNA binding protein